jgi:tRNA dimethylallyltransferase
MVAQGFIDEVRALRERPRLTPDSASMRAVGYRQIWAWLDGRYAWEEAEQRAVTATRQLAKRQLTWLRGDPGTEKLDKDDHRLLEQLRRRLGEMLDGA